MLSLDNTEPYTARGVAPSQLESGDRHQVYAFAYLDKFTRRTIRTFGAIDATTSLQLPPKITGVTAAIVNTGSYPPVSASWVVKPEVAAYRLIASDRLGVNWNMLVSASAMNESGTAELPDLSMAPGWHTDYEFPVDTYTTTVQELTSNKGMAPFLSALGVLPVGTVANLTEQIFSLDAR